MASAAAAACGGRDHAIPRPDARPDRGIERPVDEVGAAGEVTGAAGSASTDAGDGPADLPVDVVAEVAAMSDAAVSEPPAADAGANADSKGGSTPVGKTCQRDVDCTSGHCREGLCCDGACAEKCQSCLSAKTGKADGTCASVKAGVSHGSDCMAADSTTCGFDGTCDGAGACRHYAVGTSCAQESCSDGVSVATYSSARTCNGTGTCAAPTTSNCNATYRCGGTKCRATCSGSQDCVAGAYCSGNACLPKKADKELCTSSAECLTGTCGGRCCAAGCSCTQPSAANLIQNAGIDNDTNSWRVNGGMLSKSLFDVEKCPYSGSLMVTVPPGGHGSLSQCVSNTPLSGDFNFGYRGQLEGEGNLVCQVRFYSGFNCDADLIITNETEALSGQTFLWQAPMPDALDTSVAGANSVIFECTFNNGSASNASSFFLDALYISRAPARF